MDCLSFLIGEFKKIIFTDLFIHISDGTLATFIGFGIAFSLFSLSQYQQYLNSILIDSDLRELAFRPFDLSNVDISQRNIIFKYKSLLSLTCCIRKQISFYIISGGLLLISLFWDKEAIIGGYSLISLFSKQSFLFVHNFCCFLVTMTYFMLLIVYISWAIIPEDGEIRDYTQMILFSLRRLRYMFPSWIWMVITVLLFFISLFITIYIIISLI